ncbi:MAG: glycosyltransferase, partial [Candidatus Omnitrophica bacterium]|nr:glycosyltransferase [Candidatus Omnitrophota bacterium]
RRDVSEILDVLDLVVLTSKWEGMPIAIIEALCKGCPVVATNVGGAAELIKEGVTGYLTKPGEYQETADCILKILEDSNALRKMKEEASLSIDSSFDIHRMLNEVESLYREST